MNTNLKTESVAPNAHYNKLSRRRVLHAGRAGVMFSMIPTGLFAATATEALQFDFGPRYSVLNVSRTLAGTQVELGFQVNGRSFQMTLASKDQVLWRPV